MLSLAQATAAVLADVEALPPERIRLEDAFGRVLATAQRAPLTLPAWDNSAMDGYAVRAADVWGATPDAPVRLRVLETVAAGRLPARPVGPSEAVRIMTGAPMPVGADCVVRVEDTDGGTDVVVVRDGRDAGRNVRPRGEDVHEGEVALPAGTRLDGAQLALLASLGCTHVSVTRFPRAAVLGSGDELVPAHRAVEARTSARVVASNGHALLAAIRRDGGLPLDLGIVPDDPAAIAERARDAESCDLLITTAGASVGAFDYTQRALGALALELAFWRVAVRPGAQTAFGRLRALGGMRWLGLPGNPVSAQVTYELFARPLLRRLLGHANPHRASVPVTLDAPVRTPGGVTHLLRAVVRVRDDGFHATPTGPQGSNLLTSTARANALLVVPPETPRLEAGARLQALPLGDDLLHAAEPCW
ncbi:MAG TPA: gephyrin-like molybdotransferase Glp [Gemmatimonadaceae bacterium]|nr:gephyrin-like molybdotransferase Glp [Gemmatimonadaceae bacterium]